MLSENEMSAGFHYKNLILSNLIFRLIVMDTQWWCSGLQIIVPIQQLGIVSQEGRIWKLMGGEGESLTLLFCCLECLDCEWVVVAWGRRSCSGSAQNAFFLCSWLYSSILFLLDTQVWGKNLSSQFLWVAAWLLVICVSLST